MGFVSKENELETLCGEKRGFCDKALIELCETTSMFIADVKQWNMQTLVNYHSNIVIWVYVKVEYVLVYYVH